MTLSIVIPVYFNEENIPKLWEILQQTLQETDAISFEYIFVDDGSGDNSYALLQDIRRRHKNVKIIKLSRNFGSHTAILTGLSYASGDCCSAISADLQDPPRIVLEMLAKYQEGYKVVLAVRKGRKESFGQRLFSNTYYKMVQQYALPNMPSGGFDCFLIDRIVVNILKSIEEKNTSLMGLILWCGFKTAHIFYVREARDVGKSRWTLAKKIKLLVDTFMAFSYMPIRLMSGIGLMLAGLGFGYGGFVVINQIFFQIKISGWSSLMVALLIFSGIQLIFLSVIGEYLWRTLDESRKRPTFLIEESEGLNGMPQKRYQYKC